MTERAERPARPAPRQSIGRKSQIAANARPPALSCAYLGPQVTGAFTCRPSSGRGTCVITAGCGLRWARSSISALCHCPAATAWVSTARSRDGCACALGVDAVGFRLGSAVDPRRIVGQVGQDVAVSGVPGSLWSSAMAARWMPARSPHQRSDGAADLAHPAAQIGPAERRHLLAGVPAHSG
jgi:hypothetical protein